MPFLRPGTINPQCDPQSWWTHPQREQDPEILLRQVGRNAFQLMWGFRYVTPDGKETYNVPEHRFERAPDDGDNSSDLASVPSWLWWFIASYGRQTRPALLHDYLVDAEPKRRRNADRVFRIALEESGIGYVRRWLMWTTVSFATWLKAGWWRLAFVLFVLHAGAFVGAVAYSIFASDWSWLGGRWWAAPALWLGLSGFLWGHRWPFTFLGIALILPPTVCVWIVIPLVWLLDLLAEGLGWIGSRIPGVGPPRDFSWPVLSPQRHRPSLF